MGLKLLHTRTHTAHTHNTQICTDEHPESRNIYSIILDSLLQEL